MNKYMVYFKDHAARNIYRKLQDVIYGYSEDDALLRYGIDRKDISSIAQHYN
jgi:hypothetical protein